MFQSCRIVWQTGVERPAPVPSTTCPVKGSDTKMANLSKKGEVHCVRFRFQGKEYKKSLKTKDASAARAALHLIEITLHRLHTGQLHVPDRVDPGDFVVSGGTLLAPFESTPSDSPSPRPSTRELTDLYITAQKNL